MPLPIVADTFKVDLIWENASAPRQAINTLHFFDSSGTKTVAQLATALNANLAANMWLVNNIGGVITRFNITPLDGITAGQTFATSGGAAVTGGSAGDFIPQGACVISLKSARRGPAGRNRVFLPWVSESQQSNGFLNSANVLAMGTAWTTFWSNMTTAGFALTAVSSVNQDQNIVTTLAVKGYLKTQRRRARR